ncbi:MAG: response regulator [bacterium]
MAVITVINGSYCNGEDVVSHSLKRLNYERIDEKLFTLTSERYQIRGSKMLHSLSSHDLFLNKLTREQEKNLTYLEATLAESIQTDNAVLSGWVGYLIPGNISHILRVCIIADLSFRVNEAVKTEGLSETDARARIREYDKHITACTTHLFQKPAYDDSLYDIVIPMNKTSVDQAVQLICDQALSDAIKTTDWSREAARDFLLSTKVKVALTEAGHNVEVFSENGHVIIGVNEQPLRMNRLQDKLKRIAAVIPGVKEVTTKLGSKYSPPSLNPWDDIETSPKILLVDDEKDFVHTLSERLQTRNLESSIAYDGEQALEMLKMDVPDVIVLDLKMPGIDGIETLRRVKEHHPEIEVIILTGHGSKREQAAAEELGAFAYLHKPVDVNELAQIMKEAYVHGRK